MPGRTGLSGGYVAGPRHGADGLVAALPPRSGFEGDRGGGPGGLLFRLAGSPDRGETGRRFTGSLGTVAAEGYRVLVPGDVRETCRQLRLGERVGSVLNLGLPANVLAVLAAAETGYVSGRAQAAITWTGHTTGLGAAKAGAACPAGADANVRTSSRPSSPGNGFSASLNRVPAVLS